MDLDELVINLECDVYNKVIALNIPATRRLAVYAALVSRLAETIEDMVGREDY